ncbi:MAG: tetratricopeptide repeat protein [Bacteroidota bacterium]
MRCTYPKSRLIPWSVLLRRALLPLISILLLLSFAPQLTAQNTSISRDWQDVSLPDTVRLDLMDSMARKVYWTKQPDSSLYVFDQLIQLARSSSQQHELRSGLRRKASLLYRIGNYQAAAKANEERIAGYHLMSYDEEDKSRYLSRAHRDLAKALRKLGRTAESLEHYETSLRYANNAGEAGRNEKANTLNSLGNLYFNLREYELAQEKYQHSLELYQELDVKVGIYSALNNLGLVSSKTGNFQQAIDYYEISLEMKKKADDRARMSNTYGSIGDVYLVWGQEAEAKAYFLQAKALQEELGMRDELTRSLTQLGNLAHLQGRPQEALQWCNQSCQIAAEDGLWQASMACQECLYKAHKALGNNTLALQAYETHIAVKDSVISMSNTQAIADLEARLTYEKQLAEAETERVQLEQEAQRERWLRWLLVGAILVLMIAAGLAIRMGRLRRRQNETLAQKNQQISQQAAELEAAAEVKNRFFTNISHELRTPLTLVTSPLEQLLSQANKLPQQLGNTLSTVRNNANKLVQLVEELLELAQLESGNTTLSEVPLLLPPYLRQIFDNYSLLAQEKSIEYQFESTLPGDLSIRTDAQRLQKIIDNLLGNALKFTPEGGAVKMIVQTSKQVDESGISIQVQDSGPGIAEQDLPFIFDRYYRASDQVSSTASGIGVGLALAYESAQLLGGSLTADSTEAEGSTFTLFLPSLISLASDEEQTQRTALPHPVTEPQPAFDHRLLIVEDNLELQTFLTQVLSDYKCNVADNGQQALQMIKEAQRQGNPYHLILTDLAMPIMDGTELIHQLRSGDQWASLRIVVLSAHDQQSDKLNLLRSGVDDFITKPFSPEELRLRLRNLLQYEINTAGEPQVSEDDEQNVNDWLLQVEQHIEHTLRTQQDLRALTLASALHLSDRQLLRKIKAVTGMSTQQYIKESRLQLAHRYLTQRQFKTVAEVARACGFSTTSYFSRLYQQRFGKSPAYSLGK